MNALKELLTSADILNTLSGGISQPIVSTSDTKQGKIVNFRVPGVRPENLRAYLTGRQLSISYVIPIETRSGGLIIMPKPISETTLSLDIDIDNIDTQWNGENGLSIILPYVDLNDMKNWEF